MRCSALVSITFAAAILPGCYLQHAAGDASPHAAGDAGPRDAPVPALSCATVAHLPFAPSGDREVSAVELATTSSGIFALYARLGPDESFPNDFIAGTLAPDFDGLAMRASLGRLAIRHPADTTLDSGPDGRVLSCATVTTGHDHVLVLDAESGARESLLPIDGYCMDVANIGGYWVVLEQLPSGDLPLTRSLTVMDGDLHVARRIPIPLTANGFADRLIAFGDRALVAMLDEDAGEVVVGLMNLSSGVLEATHTLERGSSGVEVVGDGEHAYVLTGHPGRGIELSVLDSTLEVLDVLTAAGGFDVQEAALFGGGVVAIVGNDEVGPGVGELVLFDPGSREVVVVPLGVAPGMAPSSSNGFDLAVRGEEVVVASYGGFPSTAWIWSGRCRIR